MYYCGLESEEKLPVFKYFINNEKTETIISININIYNNKMSYSLIILQNQF